MAMALSSAQKPAGNLKQLIAYVGMAWITALIRNSLPAWDNNFSSTLATYTKTLSLISLKALRFALPTTSGNPKYFSNRVVGFEPNMEQIESRVI
jgi:hypothetical protein